MTKVIPLLDAVHFLAVHYQLLLAGNKTACMRTIIAPTNFSDSSLNAVNYAADMAVNTDACLVLLHVISIPDSFDIPVIPLDYDGMLKSAWEQLDELKKQLELRTQDGIDISVKAVFASMVMELQELYRQTHPFVVVIGPEREGTVERFLFGSHTFSLASHMPCPVIVVPANAKFRYIRRIALATDLKDIQNIPVESIGAVVELFDATLDIIHVCASQQEKDKLATSVANIQNRLQLYEPTFYVEINKSIEAGVDAYAKRNREDLVIVMPKRHSFFQSLFHKSSSKKIALHPSVPVAAIPA